MQHCRTYYFSPDALRIGTSGWNYPTGKGSWNGIFYPLPEDRERGFDELRFYSERFNTVEVNSTFYGQPRANASLGWVKRTPADFEFAVKLYQKFTHPNMAIDPGPVTQADVDAFKGGIDPLAAAGKLGPLLIQFPASFQRSQEAVDYVAWLLKAFAGYPLAVELRHRSWSDAPETAQLLDATSRGVGANRRTQVPVVDSTGSEGSAGGPVLPAAARTQREGMVGPRRIGRSLQLFLFGRGAASRSPNKVRDVRARW